MTHLTVLKYLLHVALIYLLFNYIIQAFLIIFIVTCIVIVMRGIMSSRSTSKETSTIGNIEQALDTTPFIFIDENLIKMPTIASIEKKENIFQKMYEIQGMTYGDDYQPKQYGEFNSSKDKWVQFELEEVDSETGFDINCSEFNGDNDDEELIIICQRVGTGYLINSNVYLTMYQWHTIICADNVFNCIACDVCFLDSLEEHINTKGHLDQLYKHKPIRRFEFSITRKFNEMFHCAVCNVTYSVTEENCHKNNNIHEYNLLAAINKASDYIYNSDDYMCEQNYMKMVTNNPSFRVYNNKYSIDDSEVGNDDFEVTSVDHNRSDDDDDYLDSKNDGFDDKIDTNHRNCDVKTVRLIKYVKFDEETTVGKENFKRPHVIQLTSNSADSFKPVIKHDNQQLGIKVNSIKHIGITKQRGHNDHSIKTIQNELHNTNDGKKSVTLEDLPSGPSSSKTGSQMTIASKTTANHDVYDPDDRLLDENIQIIIKKTHFVIDLFAYNSIVFYGDAKYCFLCKTTVSNGTAQKHIKNQMHIDNMVKHSFLENYSQHLIRQNHFKYHCGICNVAINHKHVTNHVEWSTHQKLSIQCKTKKSLRKSIKVINVATQREDRVLNVNAPKIKILLHVEIVATPQTSQTIDKIVNKHVILNGRIIDFYNWNGLCKLESGFRCLICDENLTDNIETHCRDRHNDVFMEDIVEKYWPALIRKMNDKYIHCIACNKLLYNDDGVISAHIEAKKHKKNHSKLMKE